MYIIAKRPKQSARQVTNGGAQTKGYPADQQSAYKTRSAAAEQADRIPGDQPESSSKLSLNHREVKTENAKARIALARRPLR